VVYAWNLRDRLPTIPIPLCAGDADIASDLEAVFRHTYEFGHYARLIDYSRRLGLSLSESDRNWAESLAKSGASG
jgi:hypothetical protein